MYSHESDKFTAQCSGKSWTLNDILTFHTYTRIKILNLKKTHPCPNDWGVVIVLVMLQETFAVHMPKRRTDGQITHNILLLPAPVI